MIQTSDSNIALSGWSGAGTSTITMMLALILNRKYYYFGSVFREVVKQLSQSQKSSVDEILPQYENIIQPTIGKIVDLYVDHILTNYHRVVLETDLSVFRIGKHPNVYSIFLKTDFEIRRSRFETDQRSDNIQVLSKRDNELQKAYQELWNIDIFNEQLILEKFNIVINNSDLTIADTLNLILQHLNRNQVLLVEPESTKIQTKLYELSKLTGKTGKHQLHKQLQEKKLMIPANQLIKDIATHSPQEIKKLPVEFRNIFQGSDKNTPQG